MCTGTSLRPCFMGDWHKGQALLSRFRVPAGILALTRCQPLQLALVHNHTSTISVPADAPDAVGSERSSNLNRYVGSSDWLCSPLPAQ